MGQLLTDALVIKNETQAAANTATRVGGWMEAAATEIERPIAALNFFDFESGSVTETIQDDWVPLKMTAIEGFKRNGLSVNIEGLVNYSGASRPFQFSFIAALIGTAGRKIHVAMFRNGELWPCSEFASTIAVQGTEISIPSQCVVPLVDGDVLQVYVKCSTHALSVTLDNINVIIKEF